MEDQVIIRAEWIDSGGLFGVEYPGSQTLTAQQQRHHLGGQRRNGDLHLSSD